MWHPIFVSLGGSWKRYSIVFARLATNKGSEGKNRVYNIEGKITEFSLVETVASHANDHLTRQPIFLFQAMYERRLRDDPKERLRKKQRAFFLNFFALEGRITLKWLALSGR